MECLQKNWKENCHMIQQFHFGYLSKDMKTLSWRGNCTFCSLQHYLQVAKTCKQPKGSNNGRMVKEVVVKIYNEILFSHTKEGNPAIYENIDGPEGIVLKKSIRERHILCKISHVKPESKTHGKKRLDLWLPVTVGWGRGVIGWESSIKKKKATNKQQTNAWLSISIPLVSWVGF